MVVNCDRKFWPVDNETNLLLLNSSINHGDTVASPAQNNTKFRKLLLLIVLRKFLRLAVLQYAYVTNQSRRVRTHM